ncbi:MAG: Crp/Fnr family transcriptional regulator [Bacteroidota bacterium]|nr:Crp/Fnr family transcriptional regulator [Bacteroidota bacterium]
MFDFKNKFNCENCTQKEQCFFRKLNKEELQIINKNREEVHFKAGETIFKQGTTSKHFVYIHSGLVKILIETDINKNFITQIVRPFHFLDFPAIFDNNRYNKSAIAIEDSLVCLIDIEVFKSIILSNTKYVASVIQHYNALQLNLSKRIISVIYKNMEGRIADALLYLVNEVYFTRSFTMTITRKDIAELAGMSKESTSRILTQFKNQKIIKVKSKQIDILDKKYLEKISRFS